VADNFVPLPEVIYLVEHIIKHYIEITVCYILKFIYLRKDIRIIECTFPSRRGNKTKEKKVVISRILKN
jgi:hypothetical protein